MINKPIDSPLQPIINNLTKHHNVTLHIKRDDLIHPLISGNKWRKLKYNLIEAKQRNVRQLVSFGGAYSNHIHAFAAAGNIYDFNTVGIIRGEEDLENQTIADAKKFGMTIHYVTRAEYRQRHNPEYIEILQQKFPNAQIIPEGGTNTTALKGVSEILGELADHNPDYVCTPCGSGGTTAGLIVGAPLQTKVISIPVLKNANYLVDEINSLVRRSGVSNNNWSFIDGYHFGGYAKIKPELIVFIEQFFKQTSIELEPIYSGKMFYGIYDLIRQGYFPAGSKIVAIHTGGLQGVNGLKQRGLLPTDWLN